jgi:hypothetical protein
VLIGAIAAIVMTIVFYPLLVATPFELEDIYIELSSVSLSSGSVEQQSLDLRISFNMTNASEYTLTTSRIDYELFADGQPVGGHTLSYEDVPVNGRPALFTNEPVTLTDTFPFDYTDSRADLFDKILNNSEEIDWSVTGTASIESGTSFQEKQFSSDLE